MGGGRVGVCFDLETLSRAGQGGYAWLGTCPALYPEWLGERSFNEVHGTRFPYIAGAMANGIASTELVIAMARAGMLAFFGAAGLGLARIEAAIDALQAALGSLPFGSNLIHSPNEPDLEAGTVDIYLRKGVRRVSASAFMALSPAVIRYAASGLRRAPDGRILRSNHLFAKVSRPEVAGRFMAPAPEDLLASLVAQKLLSPEEARLAREVPVAEDVTMEADSGGHTDNRPLNAMLPVMLGLRDRLAREHGYTRPIRVGAAGGLGTPAAVASAFAMGAAYVLTGSVNQASPEAALSPRAKQLLCEAGPADVTMAPAADMFELGVEVQVLRRGTLFAARAHRLRDLYRRHGSLEEIGAADRQRLEKEIFCAPLDEVWEQTRRFFLERDPRQIARAEADPRHRMALVFRSYLGRASRWAITGDPERVLDYQIWCGPAQGAFNDWVKGSPLEPLSGRGVVQIALNLLEGAAVLTRAHQLRTGGVPLPMSAFDFRPRPLA